MTFGAGCRKSSAITELGVLGAAERRMAEGAAGGQKSRKRRSEVAEEADLDRSQSGGRMLRCDLESLV
jgi:hypothetical protein